MLHCNANIETLDFMRVKREMVNGKDMGQYFHARWRKWSFLIIDRAKDLSIGWQFRIESRWAEEVQGNVTLLNEFSPL